MSEYVQYVVVRRDLGLTSGKLAAQVAHAALGAVLPHYLGETAEIRCYEGFEAHGSGIGEWFEGSAAKIVLAVPDRAALSGGRGLTRFTGSYSA